jgi:hypothetical protein
VPSATGKGRKENIEMTIGRCMNIVVCVAAVLASGGASSLGAPAVTSVSGDFEHGSAVTISGSGFGSKSPAGPVLWDTVDNQAAYSGLSDGDDIPSSAGYPWSVNSTYGDKVEYCTSRTMRGQETAHYHWLGKGYLGWPRAMDTHTANDNHQFYVYYWWKPEWDPNDDDGGKFMRVWDNPSGTDTRISWTSHSTYWVNYFTDGTVHTDYGDWSGNGGEWNSMELWADADTGILQTWVNCAAEHELPDFDKADNGIGLSTGRLGFDPRYSEYYTDFDNEMADLYLDITQARVMIGNASTWSGCSHREIQIPSSWSSSSISATVNTGAFSDGTAYLYVMDEDGAVNSSGYQITIGGGGQTYYDLTVNSGSGDGSYTASTNVNVSADAAPSGHVFDCWVGDTACVDDVDDPTTTVTMPADDVEITATYQPGTYYGLTVNSGSGDGDYEEDEVVNISADAAPSGYAFDCWVGDTAYVTDVDDPTTAVTMPADDVEVTATYESAGGGGTTTIVDWGDSAGNNYYGFSDWDNVYLGMYTSYSSLGPDGIMGGWTGIHHTAGVNGSSASFAEGDTIVVTWYNTAGSGSLTFTPKVSFDDPDSYNLGTSGTWYDMSQLELAAGQTGTTEYTFSAGTAGNYSRVHVSRVANATAALLMDKFELTTGGPAYYTLTVNSGSGDGDYEEDAVVGISADTPPAHTAFDEWVGDTACVTSVTSSSTNVTMPADDVTVTATYTNILYTLTVNSGSGDGSYAYGANVGISADTPPAHMEFDEWVGDTAYVDDVDYPTATVIMPGDDVTITATYTDVLYTLTVNSGSGDGSYAYGTPVNISADAAASGYAFDCWTGDTAHVDDVDDPTTAVTMPDDDVEVTATYRLTATQGTVHFREGGGTGYTDVTFDDTWIKYSPADNNTHGDASYNGIQCTTSGVASLLAVKDLFSQLPKTDSGSEIVIAEALLHLTRYQGAASSAIGVWRATTDWVPDAAGANENDASGLYAEVSSSTDWADGAFSDADYDDSVCCTAQWTETSNGEVVVDVTDLVAGMYEAEVNYGFALTITSGTSLYARASEYSTLAYRPSLEITYEYASSGYDLTVNSGSGDGSYDEDQVVNISADAAPSGMFFDNWKGDTDGIADVNDPTTTVTMPASSVEVTATYTWVEDGLVSRYTFDVDASDSAGSNDGTLTNGASVATDGERGKVLSLDGSNDYVALPSSEMTAGRSELTLAMWVKPDVWTYSRTIYDEYGGTGGAYWQFTVANGGFYTRDSSTGTNGARNNDLTTPTLSTGEWQHVAMVYSVNNSLKAIYIDGEPAVSTSTSVDTLTSDRAGAGIGYACDGLFFDGMIDDVRLYSRALSEDEIELLAGQ